MNSDPVVECAAVRVVVLDDAGDVQGEYQTWIEISAIAAARAEALLTVLDGEAHFEVVPE